MNSDGIFGGGGSNTDPRKIHVSTSTKNVHHHDPKHSKHPSTATSASTSSIPYTFHNYHIQTSSPPAPSSTMIDSTTNGTIFHNIDGKVCMDRGVMIGMTVLCFLALPIIFLLLFGGWKAWHKVRHHHRLSAAKQFDYNEPIDPGDVIVNQPRSDHISAY